MDIATKLTDLTADLHECRRAITYRGGEISARAGFKEVAEKIKTLPASSSVGTVIDEDMSLLKLVPSNSTKYCYLKSLGGMTYKSNNLIPFPYYDGKDVGYTYTTNGVTYTVNADRSITINGTSTYNTSIIFGNYYNLPDGDYVFSANHISGEWVSGAYIRNTAQDMRNNHTVTKFTSPERTLTWWGIYVTQGTTVNNLTFKPMLNRGSTALPYEDYYAGLKDTKPTAIKVHGANYLKPYNDIGYTKTSAGITFTVNGDGSITVSGTAKGTPAFVIGNHLNLPAADYYLAGNCVDGEWVSGVNVYTAATNSVYYTTSKTTPVVKIPANAKFTWISIQVLNGTTVENLTFKPMLSMAQALPYTDYHEPIIYPIPEALRGTGKGIDSTYHDSVDFEKSKAITKVGERLLKDVFTAATGISGYGFYTYTLQNKFVGNNLLCDAYTADTWNNVYAGGTDRCIAGNGSAIILSDTRYTDIASFRASLTDEKLMYATTTPTETDIDTSSFNPLIEVEAGGSIEFITDSGKAPNSTIIYQTVM